MTRELEELNRRFARLPTLVMDRYKIIQALLEKWRADMAAVSFFLFFFQSFSFFSFSSTEYIYYTFTAFFGKFLSSGEFEALNFW